MTLLMQNDVNSLVVVANKLNKKLKQQKKVPQIYTIMNRKVEAYIIIHTKRLTK